MSKKGRIRRCKTRLAVIRRRLGFAAALLAAMAPWCSAWGDQGDNPDPRALLAAAAKAIREVHTAIYDVELAGTGSIMGDAPRMRGKVKLQRSGPEGPEGSASPMRAAARGTILRRAIGLETDDTFALVLDADSLRIQFNAKPWQIEVDQKRLPHVVWNRPEMGLVLEPFLSPTPLVRQLAARQVRFIGRQDVAGIRCDQIDVDLTPAKGEAPAAPLSRLEACTRQRWSFGVDDHLPRRVEYIRPDEPRNSGAAEPASVVITLSNLEINGTFTEGVLDMPHPHIWAPGFMCNFDYVPAKQETATPKVAITPSDDGKSDGTKSTNGEEDGKRKGRRRDAGDKPEPADVGDAAPAWELKDTEGQTHKLADLRGKVVVADFWATWCPKCRQSRPALDALAEQFKGGAVVFVSINCMEGKGDPVGYLKEHRFKSTPLLDGNATAKLYGVKGIPDTFVIDPSGKIVHRIHGYTPEMKDELAGVIKKLMANGE